MNEPFVASNGIEIHGGEDIFITDKKAKKSESRMMTIQARKTQALREYFAQEEIEVEYVTVPRFKFKGDIIGRTVT